MQHSSSMILLDEGSSWDGDSRLVVNWSEVLVSTGQESLPLKVEELAPEIKKEYLAWVYDLGQSNINGKTLASQLQINENLSAWWMTLVEEKSTYRCPSIYKVFKLRALEKLYLVNDCRGLIYCGNDQHLQAILENWLKKLNHPYQRHSSEKCVVNTGLTGIRKRASRFPYWIQALAYLFNRWRLIFKHIRVNKSVAPTKINKDYESSVTIVTYFPNIDLEKTEQGRFWSHYWEQLHNLLDQMPVYVNWVWMYSKSKEVSFKETTVLQRKCNQARPEKYRYFLLEDFLNIESFFKAIKIYWGQYRKGLKLKDIQNKFVFPDSKLNFYPMMEYDWNASIFGHFALNSALELSMFSNMAQKFPKMRWLLFNWENQPWEKALISTWKLHQKKSKSIAYQHTSAVRPMDLRAFFDPRVVKQTGVDAMPFPDILAVNGSINKKLLQECGYSDNKIFKVEALRSLTLAGRYRKKKKDLKPLNRTLFVTTGYIHRENEFQLKLLKDAERLDGLKKYSKILIKPHPYMPVETILESLKFEFQYEITHLPLADLWANVDVLYCANSTAVCSEATWLGFPVIVAGSLNELNLNPLFGFADIEFMTNASMLAEKLQNPIPMDIPEEYFYLDKDLNRWVELLKL
jgi:surface carbohydrate biosynthesis protein (TIGR04326 family)